MSRGDHGVDERPRKSASRSRSDRIRSPGNTSGTCAPACSRVWIGSLQNMYPQLGASVENHSILLREPLQQVARSVYPIMGVVYDGERARQTR